MSGVMPTLCSRASASLLFLSRSESSWPTEDPASAPRFESPYRVQGQAKNKAALWQVCKIQVKLENIPTYILLFLLLFFSLLLLSNLGDPLFLPLEFSLQLTLVRHTAGWRFCKTVKRLFKKSVTPCSCIFSLNYYESIKLTKNRLLHSQ